MIRDQLAESSFAEIEQDASLDDRDWSGWLEYQDTLFDISDYREVISERAKDHDLRRLLEDVADSDSPFASRSATQLRQLDDQEQYDYGYGRLKSSWR